MKSQLEIAIDALDTIQESPKYAALKDLVVKQTGGLKLEDVLKEANRFSKAVDNCEMIALQNFGEQCRNDLAKE